jgi:hypothetical protein
MPKSFPPGSSGSREPFENFHFKAVPVLDNIMAGRSCIIDPKFKEATSASTEGTGPEQHAATSTIPIFHSSHDLPR